MYYFNSPSLVFWTSFIIILMIIVAIQRVMRQKTRSPQQRRMYVGSRARPSLGQHEPTIYVSPSNLPPPPKYECMAPPSYEEVVGIHYPNYQVTQPIAQPIATALAQNQPGTTSQASDTATTNDNARTNDTRSNDATVVTTVNERPTVTSS